jgi:DNA modification methylase
MAVEHKFAVQQPGVWSKKSGACNSPSNLMISTYENFLLLRKGRATFNQSSFPNVLEYATVPSGQRIHQWEKPVGLYRYLISQLGRENSVYLSLFTGSGNSLIAAAMEGMKPIGCDTSQKYIHSFYRRFDNYFM